MQGALDHLKGRPNSRIWRLAMLSHLQALPSQQELDARHLPASLPSKGDTRFVDILVRRIERFESIRNPPYQMRRQPRVLAFNM
jgi:hypothetical protein